MDGASPSRCGDMDATYEILSKPLKAAAVQHPPPAAAKTVEAEVTGVVAGAAGKENAV